MSASPNEARRLAELERYAVFDANLETPFVDLARLAAHVADAAAATVSFVGTERVWFGARFGTEATGGPRAGSLCDAVVAAGRQVVIAEDASVGTPLRSSGGYVLGSLCVFGARGGELSSRQLELLEVIARQVETQLALRCDALARAHDLTESRAAAGALEEAVARMRAILETAADGIITIDERGVIDSFNPAAARIFGYEPGEVIGRNVSSLMPRPVASEHDDYLATYRRTGVAHVIGIGREVMGLRKDGSTIPLDLAVSEVHFGDRRMFTGILRDIRERKLVEQAKDEFVSTVSHELRTPLTAISGSLRLLEGGVVGELSGEALELVSVASRNAQRLIRLINDILDLERISSGPIVEYGDVAFAEIVERAIGSIGPLARDAGVEITAEVTGRRVVGDADQLVQVLVNLLSNAVKFSPEGAQVQVLVADRGTRVRAEVVDSGPGIAERDRERIFDRFQQVDSTDRRRKGGSGLGLSISRAIVQTHGGDIGVVSAVGSGSRFWFEIPAAE